MRDLLGVTTVGDTWEVVTHRLLLLLNAHFKNDLEKMRDPYPIVMRENEYDVKT
jgi:hypothetical protein